MIQDKIFFDEKDPTGLSYNTPFTYFGSYQGRLWSKAPGGEIKYYTQNSDLSVYAITGSNQFNGNQAITGSLTVTGGIIGTTATSSYVEYSNVANKPTLVSGSSQVSFNGITNKPTLVSGSSQVSFNGITNKPTLVSSSVQVKEYNVFATTGSNGFNGSQSITGSLTVTGQVVAQTLNVQQVTSSIVYSSGSNVFGNTLGNTQQFTGSVSVTGSLAVNGAGTFSGNVTLSGTNSQLLQTISNSIAGDNAAVFYNSNANSYGLYIGAGSGTNHALYITDSTRTANLFKVQGNGNVGIGTATPVNGLSSSRTLNIYGTSGIGGEIVIEGNSGGNFLSMNAGTSAGDLPIILFNRGLRIGHATSKDATGYSTALAIASTGAATFSSSVTAKGILTIGESLIENGIINSPEGIYINADSDASGGTNDIVFGKGRTSTSGGTTFMTIKNAGNVGIGTASPAGILNASDGSGATRIIVDNTANAAAGAGIYMRTFNGATQVSNATLRTDNAGNLDIFTGTTGDAKQMTITPSGNVGIGTNNPFGILNARQSNANSLTTVTFDNSATIPASAGTQGTILRFRSEIDDANLRTTGAIASYAMKTTGAGANNNGDLRFYTGQEGDTNERMRINSGGYTKASNTGTYFNSTNPSHEFNQSIADWNTQFINTHASIPYGIFLQYSAAPNSTGSEFLYCRDNNGITVRATIRSNGGIANYQANDVNLSDERVKKDIEPLESYWDKFKAIEIVKFKYKDQTHDDFNIGVIAQQVEEVAPEFVDVDGWNKPELDEEGNEIVSEEEPLKAIYTADLYHATIKVLQEAMAKIETLEAEIQTLKQ